MKPAHHRASLLGVTLKRVLLVSLLFITSAGLLSSCYTRFAGQGDYYGYTGRVHKAPAPVHSDTLVRTPQAQPQTAVKYDTIMHGDTMFIDEHPKAQAAPQANQSYSDGTTIINNYYGDDWWYYPSYWDYYWHPHHAAITIEIGRPWYAYHSWYSPWYGYYPDWYYPYYGHGYCGDYYYAGYYPPVYDCYAPFYSYYGPGYYYPYYGYDPYYGYNPYYGGWSPDYRRANNLRTPHSGRLGGESRSTAMTPGLGGPSTVGVRSGVNTTPSIAGSNVSANRVSTRTSIPANVTTENGAVAGAIADRNAPVHVMSPDVAGAGAMEGARANAPANTANAPANTSGVQVSSTARTTTSHPIVVRRSGGQVVSTTTTARDASGNQRVIVRRSPQGAANGATTRSRNYGPAARSNDTPSRSYDRGNSGRAGGYTRGESTPRSSGDYSAPRSSGNEGSSSRSSGGERNSGGERSGGGERSSGRGAHDGGNAR